MLLQPVVTNAFPQDSGQDLAQTRLSANAFGNQENSPLLNFLEQAEELCKLQDKHIDHDLHAHSRSRNSTARMLNLLQLQYDIDDMNFSATLAKNVANQFSQALTTITQRN